MKHLEKHIRWFTIIAVLLVFGFAVNAQSRATLNCGDILEAETNANEPYHDYALAVQAGTTLDIIIEPVGVTFNVTGVFYDSGGGEFARVNSSAAGVAESFDNLLVGSSNPILRIIGTSPQVAHIGFSDQHSQHFGAYIVSFGCTLRDGRTIPPGSTLPDPTPILPTHVPTQSPADPGFVGFPGLPPVSFTSAFKLSLNLGSPNQAEIPPGLDAVFGFTLNANASDVLDLSITRVSGNLNLGVVILSPDNKVVFYGGLITSDSLSTRLTLPSAGQYTIGVFRVDLLPPDAPEATAFQVTGTLNP